MRSFLRFSRLSAAAGFVLLLASCAQSVSTAPSPSPASAATTQAPQPLTARTALDPLYTAAYKWAPDIALIRMTAREVPGFKNDAGKAAMWEAVFASPSLHQFRAFTWSAADFPPDIHRGVTAQLASPWAGYTRDAMPIDMSMFHVDSDAAYATAASQSAAWRKSNPARLLSTIEVGSSAKYPAPAWYVAWGDKKSGYIALVNADSGSPFKPAK